jgi:hypothetical protein
MSLAEINRAAVRAALAPLRKKLERLQYLLDSTESIHDPIEALKEAQHTSAQLVTDLGLAVDRLQARLGS